MNTLKSDLAPETPELSPMIEEEEQALSNVQDLLRLPRPEANLDREAVVAEMLKLRDQIPQAQTDERPGLILQYERLGHLLEQQGRSAGGPGVDPEKPYFAHLRLKEGKKERDVYLGKATRLDNGLRIVDWRHAPVSTLFYRYQEGDEYVEELGGRTVEGQVVARRILGISEGELRRIQAPQGTFLRGSEGWTSPKASSARLHGGAGSAPRVVSSGQRSGRSLGGGNYRVDKHLPEISALIDPAQFEIITDEDSQLVVVRGVAGSGKTTVALHRLAYLNYKNRGAFRADRMLVVVWGEALRRFISKVLPALGVPGTQVRTFAFWARGIRERLFPFLPVATSGTTPAVVTRLKLHPALLPIAADYVAKTKGPRTARQAVEDWTHLVTDRSVLKRGFKKYAPGAFSDDELARFLRWTKGQLDRLAEFLDPEDYDGDDSPGDEDSDFDKGFLDDEDTPLLLRLYQLRVGALPTKRDKKRPLRYQHIVVDEVQDLSPMEVRVLMDCLDQKNSMTLAGDTQQHVLQEAGFSDWEEFFSHLGVQGSSVNTLKVAYRSTQQIVDFARGLLGDLAEDESPEAMRTGEPVEIFHFDDHGECSAFLVDALRALSRDEPSASVGVLAREPELADLYFADFERAELDRARRVRNQDFSFGPGIEVADIVQAKGLEFDYVVLLGVNAHSYPDTPSARRLLHVGATRAAHQLWVMAVGKQSPLLPAE